MKRADSHAGAWRVSAAMSMSTLAVYAAIALSVEPAEPAATSSAHASQATASQYPAPQVDPSQPPAEPAPTF